MTKGSDNPKKLKFASIVQETKERRGIPTTPYRASEEYLEKIRRFEKSQADTVQQISLSIARGEDLDRLALLDSLTDLYNHRTFIKELKAELGRSERYGYEMALCLIMIDNFDDLRRSYGPLTTESILKITGNVLKNSIREIDIAGRYDTNQFILAIPKSSVAAGSIVAERIRQRIAGQGISYNWQNFSITASLGVSAYPAQAAAYDELIACAYEAMDRAAASGGDRVLAI